MFSLLLASVDVWHTATQRYRPKDRFWCLRPLAEDELHGVSRAHMHRHTSPRVLQGPLIWIRSSRPPRCPSGRRRRKSSCAEHLSETAPAEHKQTNLQRRLTLQTLNSVINGFDLTCLCCDDGDWWARGSEEQRAICELQPVSSCREMARQPGFTPPPCGFKACPATASETFTPSPHTALIPALTKTPPHPSPDDITL